MSGNTTPTTPLDEVKTWANALVQAVDLAAEEYEQQPGVPGVSLVQTLVTSINNFNAALQQTQDASSAQSWALQIIGFFERAEETVGQFIPQPYLEISLVALMMLQAFVQGLPLLTTEAIKAKAGEMMKQ